MDEKDALAAKIFLELNVLFPVRKRFAFYLPQRNPEALRNLLREPVVASQAEYSVIHVADTIP